MAELDELMTGALRDLAAEAPGLAPLSPRARRRIRAGRAARALVSVVVAAGLFGGAVVVAQALNRTARPSTPSTSSLAR